MTIYAFLVTSRRKRRKMNSTERRLKIYDILVENETVDVGELSQHFGVSSMTIRRDLAIFEKQGLLTTTYGGAYLNNNAPENSGIFSAASELDSTVRNIGAAAGQLLKNGNLVFLDSGHITSGIVYGIKNLSLTIMTNSLAAANILRAFPRINLIMAPGEYDESIFGFLSSSTIAFIRKYNFDMSFINGNSLDVNAGLTVGNEKEAHFKATVMDCSAQNAVMLKSESIDRVDFAQVAALRKINYVITDRGISKEQEESFEKRGVSIITSE